jgi:hypothetical protein
MPVCPVCSNHKNSVLLEYQHWLSASKNPNEYRHLTYWCERGKHYVILQRQQTGNLDLPTAIRVVILTPTGKAAKVAETRKFGKYNSKMKVRA